MVAARKSTRLVPAPPPKQASVIIHGDEAIADWLDFYWRKLQLPPQELSHLAITQDRREFTQWTGKRLNIMALGCYCYLPAPTLARRSLLAHLPVSAELKVSTPGHRHLIFVEPDMQPRSIQVTVAHELIHLADRVHGTPRRHRHHGYDSIAADEAAITGYSLEELRRLLNEESQRRENQRRARRPIRYLYECPICGKEYPRTRRYSQAVSCSKCDKSYNPCFRLRLKTEQVSHDF
jgi:predicted SprT family Zn-dependent metalloprotease